MRDPSLRALRVLGLSAVLRPNYPYTVLCPVPTLSSPLLSPLPYGEQPHVSQFSVLSCADVRGTEARARGGVGHPPGITDLGLARGEDHPGHHPPGSKNITPGVKTLTL